ncbi:MULTISPECIES: helicase associated domain-containing protein [unclassified Streptomyces]|uniref:helicase associated domain-containing protein n=1 Tax=unclassified Streptomyces TaxID=2593676 RepID=UPI00386B49ED
MQALDTASSVAGRCPHRRAGRAGPQPDAAARANAKTGAAKGSDAFQRGVAALRQYIQREGRTVVGRQHVEELPDGTSVRLGVFLSNQKNRRDRLSEKQLAALAALGLAWAA